MTALRCTQKLLTAMKVKPAAPWAGRNVLGDWSLNLLHVHPVKLVVAMSEHDRFAFALEAAPYATLPQRFVEALFVRLQAIGVAAEVARQECDAMQPLVITATTPYSNRLSLQANLKDYAWLVEDMLYEGPFTIAQINARLADFLIGFNGRYDYPYQRVLAALSRPGDNGTS